MFHTKIEKLKQEKLIFHAIIVAAIFTVISLIFNDLLSIIFNCRFHIN